MVLAIRRIDCSSDDAARAIAELRRELSPLGNVVSPEGRARTIAAFGEPLSPQQVVERICADVAERGLNAVLDYSRRIDGRELTTGQVKVSPEELREALCSADAAYLESIASRPLQYPGIPEAILQPRPLDRSRRRHRAGLVASTPHVASASAFRVGPRPIRRVC